MLDIYSRYVVGWMVATVESGDLATRFIAESLEKQGIIPGKLTIHADRGTSMKSKPVTQLMTDLGVTKSHRRPRVGYTGNHDGSTLVPTTDNYIEILRPG